MHREQPFFQKYKRHILVVVIILIAGPFIFWVVPGGAPRSGLDDAVLIDVDGIPVNYSSFMRQLTQARQARPGQEAPTMEQLQATGVVDSIIEQLIQEALLRRQEARRGFAVSRQFLESHLKRSFEREDGALDALAWNDFVKGDPNRNWNAIFEEAESQLNRQLSLALMQGPAARVTETELARQVEDAFTELQVRYARIEPPVVPTEEQIQAHYDENPEMYRGGDEYKARFAALSLQPTPPPAFAEIFERLANGEDFSVLANEFSEVPGADDTGGFMDWQSPSESDLPHRAPLFELAVGEVGEPVFGSGGYYLYKVEDERINPETEKREVLARQIFLRASLSPEEREWQTAQSERIRERARELDSLEEAAGEMHLVLQETGFFGRNDDVIEGVPDTDARYISRTFPPTSQEDDTYRFAQGQVNLYVGEIVETREGEIPPLDEVRDRVVQQVINAEKRTDAYKARVEEYVTKISEQANSLDEIATVFPELELEIAEGQPFTGKDSFISDIFVRAEVMFDLTRDAEVGAFLGPVNAITQQTLFFELIKRDLPDEDMRGSEEFLAMFEERREQAITTAENQLIADYLRHLLEQALDTVPIRTDQALLARALGLDRQPAPTQAPEDMVIDIEEFLPEDAQVLEIDPGAIEEEAPSPAE